MEIAEHLEDLRAAANEAIAFLQETIEDEDHPAKFRLEAARVLLDYSKFMHQFEMESELVDDFEGEDAIGEDDEE